MKAKTTGRTGLMSIKLDMSKAFDRVEWNFLCAVLRALGFSMSVVNIIHQCISSVSFSFLLNGAQFGSLIPQRGIRQGDPLSPYLFLICSEVFSCLLQDLQACGRIHGIAVSRQAPRVSHLFFADDTLLFGQATPDEANYMLLSLQLYEKVSGQRINKEKSGILFSPNTDAVTRQTISSTLGIAEVDSHAKYLGLPSVVGRNKKKIFSSIKDRVWKKIQGWKERTLSKVGKEVLIKSVIQAIPTYAMSCFRLPDTVLDDIQSMASAYWWDASREHKKIHWASWDRMSRSKSNGGLGFRNLSAFNLAMLSKQSWRLLTNPSSLLSKIFKAKYFPNCHFLEATLGCRPSWTWRSILEGRKVIQLGARKLIRSGLDTRIWGDPWLPRDGGFFIRSPSQLLSGDSMVSSLMDPDTHHWNCTLVNDIFQPEEAKLILSIPLINAHGRDLWMWHYDKHGRHSVRSAYHSILSVPSDFNLHCQHASTSQGAHPLWKKLWKLRIPARVQHFMWRLCSDSLPTMENLLRRGISFAPTCVLCDGPYPSTTHLFFHCAFASQVWYMAGFHEIIQQFQQPRAELWTRDLLLACTSGMAELLSMLLNEIWMQRNNKVFGHTVQDPYLVVASAGTILQNFVAAHKWPEKDSSSLGTYSLLQHAPEGTKLYFDGAISSSKNCAGIGVAVQAPDGSFQHGFARRFPGITDPELAESLALREAIQVGLQLGIQRFSVLGDAANIILAVRGEIHCPVACLSILTEVKDLLYHSCLSGVFWIKRTDNVLAHELAHFAKSNVAEEYSWTSPPDFLCQSVLDDFQQI